MGGVELAALNAQNPNNADNAPPAAEDVAAGAARAGAAAPQQPAAGAGGGAPGRGARRGLNLPDAQNSMAEMFEMYPHESAIVMRRGIELGIVCSCVLVTHCLIITVQHWNSEVEMDILLRYLAMVRILLAGIRPYY